MTAKGEDLAGVEQDLKCAGKKITFTLLIPADTYDTGLRIAFLFMDAVSFSSCLSKT
jgi:hypothetical protein